jgi:PAS domain S-box-containing protein
MDQTGNFPYQEVFSASPDAIVCSNEAGLISLWNPAAEQMFGYSAAEALGQPLTILMTADDQNKHIASFKHFISTGESRILGKTIEVTGLRRDGATFPVELSLSSRITEQGWNFTAILRDFTERKLAEDELKQSRKAFKILADYNKLTSGLSVDAIIHSTLKLLRDRLGFEESSIAVIDSNKNCFRLKASTHSEGLGFRCGLTIPLHATVLSEVIKAHQPRYRHDINAEDSNYEIDKRLLEAGFRSDFLVPLWVEGECLGTLNIAEKKVDAFAESDRQFITLLAPHLAHALQSARLFEALYENEANFRNLANSDFNALIVHKDFHFLYANPAAQKIFEASSMTHVLGKSVLDYVHPRYRNFARLSVQRMCKRKEAIPPVEIKAVTPSGQELDIEIASTPIHFDGSPAVLSIVHDVTVRKQAEKSLRKLSQAIEQAGESILITDRQGIIEYINPAFTKLTGYSSEEAIGQTPAFLKSGNQDDAFFEDMWKTVMAGKLWHGKVINRKKDGSFYPAMLTISPIYDHADDDVTSYTHFVAIQADLTEFEAMENRFHQAQRMETLGTLVGGIAHEFNNMLAGMTGNIYLARLRARKMPDVVQKLDNIESISFRAADMIQQLLTFAHKDMVSMKRLPINPFIKETLKFLRTSVPENIDLRQEICADPLQINGDGAKIHQVILNLVNNACDAVAGVDEPHITVRLESFHANESFIEKHSYFKAGFYAHLSVEDNGCGIPEHQLEHLFEPFFTTKDQGKGTGLGLSMVFGAMKTHHGFVEVESIEGEGSIFHIYLPLIEPERVVSAPMREQEAVRGHDELILLVDDQQQIIKTGKDVLESLGYAVMTATDGRQAVEIFKAHSQEIDLVIMDVVMPVMGGAKAAQNMRRINPDAKVIFSTGYDKTLQTDMENEVVLSKPFSIVEMSHLIRQLLTSGS